MAAAVPVPNAPAQDVFRLIPLTEGMDSLKAWLMERPLLESAKAKGNQPVQLPAVVQARPISEEKQSCATKFGLWVQAHWDRGRLMLMPNLGTPCLFLGMLPMTFGVLGGITVVTGVKFEVLN